MAERRNATLCVLHAIYTLACAGFGWLAAATGHARFALFLGVATLVSFGNVIYFQRRAVRDAEGRR